MAKNIKNVYQILEESFDESYNERLEHRHNCKEWKKGRHCLKCGFGLNEFKEDVLKIFMQKKVTILTTKFIKDKKVKDLVTLEIFDRISKEADKQIVYIDKFGRKWEKKAIDEIFDALTQKKKIDNVLDYYAFEED